MQYQSLLQAASFAAEKHRNQRRKDPESTPYINHPLAVAKILTECNVQDLATLQAALLHDTVEDTKTTFAELEEHFDVHVASIVREVTDDKSLPKDVRKRLQVEHAAHATKQARLVKLADKLHNLTSLTESIPKGWTPDRVQGYFIWSEKVVDAARGVNPALEARLDSIFLASFTCHGKSWPCLPQENKELLLEQYYESMKTKDD